MILCRAPRLTLRRACRGAARRVIAPARTHSPFDKRAVRQRSNLATEQSRNPVIHHTDFSMAPSLQVLRAGCTCTSPVAEPCSFICHTKVHPYFCVDQSENPRPNQLTRAKPVRQKSPAEPVILGGRKPDSDHASPRTVKLTAGAIHGWRHSRLGPTACGSWGDVRDKTHCQGRSGNAVRRPAEPRGDRRSDSGLRPPLKSSGFAGDLCLTIFALVSRFPPWLTDQSTQK